MTYFITENYLKSNVPITDNVDITDIIFNTRIAADFNIRPILGTYFYKHMLDGYNAQTLTADELDLLDYIQPAVAWRATSESVITLTYQLKNKGLQTQSGDYSLNPEYKEVMFVAHHYGDKAGNYDNQLTNYLKENRALFPEFESDLNKDSIAKRCDGNNFNQNIFFI